MEAARRAFTDRRYRAIPASFFLLVKREEKIKPQTAVVVDGPLRPPTYTSGQLYEDSTLRHGAHRSPLKHTTVAIGAQRGVLIGRCHIGVNLI